MTILDVLQMIKHYEDQRAEIQATMLSQGMATEADKRNYEEIKRKIALYNQKLDEMTR